MYIDSKKYFKCSECGNIGYPERVNTGSKGLLRCVSCGHEKIISDISVNMISNDPYNYVSYDMNDINQVEEF